MARQPISTPGSLMPGHQPSRSGREESRMPPTAETVVTVGPTTAVVAVTMADGISVHVQMPRPPDAERQTEVQLERSMLRHAQRVLEAAAQRIRQSEDEPRGT